VLQDTVEGRVTGGSAGCKGDSVWWGEQDKSGYRREWRSWSVKLVSQQRVPSEWRVRSELGGSVAASKRVKRVKREGKRVSEWVRWTGSGGRVRSGQVLSSSDEVMSGTVCIGQENLSVLG
jgi:hypothetical protein